MSTTGIVGTLTELGRGQGIGTGVGLGIGVGARTVLNPLRAVEQGFPLATAESLQGPAGEQGRQQVNEGAQASTTSSPAMLAREHKLTQAAGQFESMLLSNLWKSMKSAFEDEDSEYSDPAHGAMDEMGMDAMSSAVGKSGGLGIAKMIMKDLTPQITGHGAPEGGAKVKALAEYRR
jgi:hypothetical protein